MPCSTTRHSVSAAFKTGGRSGTDIVNEAGSGLWLSSELGKVPKNFHMVIQRRSYRDHLNLYLLCMQTNERYPSNFCKQWTINLQYISKLRIVNVRLQFDETQIHKRKFDFHIVKPRIHSQMRTIKETVKNRAWRATIHAFWHSLRLGLKLQAGIGRRWLFGLRIYSCLR